METTKTITLTNFEIVKKTSEKTLQEYFIIINNDNRDEAYFCFSNMVKKGWDNLNKSPSPLNIEIEYEENEQNGKIYKRAIALYTDDDILV